MYDPQRVWHRARSVGPVDLNGHQHGEISVQCRRHLALSGHNPVAPQPTDRSALPSQGLVGEAANEKGQGVCLVLFAVWRWKQGYGSYRGYDNDSSDLPPRYSVNLKAPTISAYGTVESRNMRMQVGEDHVSDVTKEVRTASMSDTR